MSSETPNMPTTPETSDSSDVETSTRTARKKFIPNSIDSAVKNKSTSKSLIDITQKNKDGPHYQLFYKIVNLMCDYQFNKKIDFYKTLSPFLIYLQNVSVDVFYDLFYTQSVTTIYPNLDNVEDTCTYTKLVYAFEKVVNLNILNSMVYIEKRNVSKFKLFNLIEEVFFTQVCPSEANQVEIDFKKEVCDLITNLRLSIINSNKRKPVPTTENTPTENTTDTPTETVQDPSK